MTKWIQDILVKSDKTSPFPLQSFSHPCSQCLYTHIVENYILSVVKKKRRKNRNANDEADCGARRNCTGHRLSVGHQHCSTLDRPFVKRPSTGLLCSYCQASEWAFSLSLSFQYRAIYLRNKRTCTRVYSMYTASCSTRSCIYLYICIYERVRPLWVTLWSTSQFTFQRRNQLLFNQLEN